MTPRERMLAYATGGLLGLLLIWFLYGELAAAFAVKESRLQAVRDDLDKQEATVRRGRVASRAIAQYEAQSLPADATAARSLYQAWLWDWLQTTEMQQISVSPVSTIHRGDTYRRLTFKASGVGDLRQVTQLLWAFYSADHLHKISQAAIQPIKDSRDLEFSFTIEALSLPGSANTETLTVAASPHLAEVDREAVLEQIIQRNLFSPPNQPPRLAAVGTQRVELGDTLRLSIKATDPDKLDRVRFSLAEAPPDASISHDGEFRWRPTELGEYSATIIATDNGTPAKQDRQTFTIRVVEKPPQVVETKPEPKRLAFDNAQHAYLTGTIEQGGQWQAWIELRTEGTLLKLRQGERIDIGSVTGVLHSVSTDHAEIHTDDKRRLLFVLGEPLSEAASMPNEL
ncbi:MAG: cadherin repeat domain-containing protein [Pirellulales bacterium]